MRNVPIEAAKPTAGNSASMLTPAREPLSLAGVSSSLPLSNIGAQLMTESKQRRNTRPRNGWNYVAGHLPPHVRQILYDYMRDHGLIEKAMTGEISRHDAVKIIENNIEEYCQRRTAESKGIIFEWKDHNNPDSPIKLTWSHMSGALRALAGPEAKWGRKRTTRRVSTPLKKRIDDAETILLQHEEHLQQDSHEITTLKEMYRSWSQRIERLEMAVASLHNERRRSSG